MSKDQPKISVACTGPIAGKPALTEFVSDHKICEHQRNLWERACPRWGQLGQDCFTTARTTDNCGSVPRR